MSDCKHLQFKAQCNVFRLTDSDDPEKVTGYTMEVSVMCMECFRPFEFIGLPNGMSPSYPTVDVEGIEARMPIRPV